MSKIELNGAFQRVVATIGYAGAGKDEVAKQLGIPAVAFSDALKNRCDTLARSFGLDLNKREDKEKFREVLVAVGRLGRSIDPDYWIKRLVLPDAPTVCITGVRYLNECLAIQEVGGTLAFVIRPNLAPSNEEEALSIEAIRQAGFNDEIQYVEIWNDGDLNTLKINAAAALDYPIAKHEEETATLYPAPDGRRNLGPTPLTPLESFRVAALKQGPSLPYEPQGTPQDFEFEGCQGECDGHECDECSPLNALADEGGMDDFSEGYEAGFDDGFEAALGEDDDTCPICGVEGCDLEEQRQSYATRQESRERAAEAKIVDHPFCQQNLVIDGDDAIPFLKSLEGADWDDVVIYRGTLPATLPADKQAVLLPLPRTLVWCIGPSMPGRKSQFYAVPEEGCSNPYPDATNPDAPIILPLQSWGDIEPIDISDRMRAEAKAAQDFQAYIEGTFLQYSMGRRQHGYVTAPDPTIYELSDTTPDGEPADYSVYAPFVEAIRKDEEKWERDCARFERQLRTWESDLSPGTCVEVDIESALATPKVSLVRRFLAWWTR